jgi:hypothetical protein
MVVALDGFPSPDLNNYGIIVQGNDVVVTNTAADGRDQVYMFQFGDGLQKKIKTGIMLAFRNLAQDIF